MPKELEPLDIKLSDSYRAQILQDVQKLVKYQTTGKADKPKTYKKQFEVVKYSFEGIKFDGIWCKGVINGKMNDCIKSFMEYSSNIDEKSPKQIKKIQLFQKFFFWNDQDKQNYENVKAGKAFKDFCFYSQSCARSPAPALVKHRDFVVIGAVVFKDDKVILAMEGVDYDKEVEGTVRAKLIVNYFVFTQKGTQVDVEQFALADPCGAVPAWVYNTALDDRCEILVLLKAFMEGTVKPEYD